jgi:hypothetical protein
MNFLWIIHLLMLLWKARFTQNEPIGELTSSSPSYIHEKDVSAFIRFMKCLSVFLLFNKAGVISRYSTTPSIYIPAHDKLFFFFPLSVKQEMFKTFIKSSIRFLMVSSTTLKVISYDEYDILLFLSVKREKRTSMNSKRFFVFAKLGVH